MLLRARVALVLALALALLGVGRIEGCPLAAAGPKRGQLRTLPAKTGQTKRFAVVVRNTGSTKLTNLAAKIALPQCVHRKPHAVTQNGRFVVVDNAQNNDVYWLGQTLAPGKSRTFSIRAKVTACAGSALEVNALAYLAEPTPGTDTCPTPATIARLSVVQPFKTASKSKPCTTPAPTATPTNYAVYATGERCIEAGAGHLGRGELLGGLQCRRLGDVLLLFGCDQQLLLLADLHDCVRPERRGKCGLCKEFSVPSLWIQLIPFGLICSLRQTYEATEAYLNGIVCDGEVKGALYICGRKP